MKCFHCARGIPRERMPTILFANDLMRNLNNLLLTQRRKRYVNWEEFHSTCLPQFQGHTPTVWKRTNCLVGTQPPESGPDTDTCSWRNTPLGVRGFAEEPPNTNIFGDNGRILGESYLSDILRVWLYYQRARVPTTTPGPPWIRDWECTSGLTSLPEREGRALTVPHSKTVRLRIWKSWWDNWILLPTFCCCFFPSLLNWRWKETNLVASMWEWRRSCALRGPINMAIQKHYHTQYSISFFFVEWWVN